MGRIINLRTSSRGSFMRCRRRWGWTDGTKGNLEAAIKPAPFWMGSGVHYALEDRHGYRNYPTAAEAFQAYSIAQRKAGCPMPDDWQELEDLSVGMMEYYDEHWLVGRDPLKTHYVNNVPQVEVGFKIPISLDLLAHLPLEEWGIEEVNYTGTLDRVSIDEEGRLWIVEYKTAKQFQRLHFETDRQISAYTWAANCLYEQPVVGVIYQQHLKKLPNPAKLLGNGTYSISLSQGTTYHIYAAALKNLYGSLEKAPGSNIKMLNNLAAEESLDSDKFVRRDFAYRNEHQQAAEGAKILLELEDYLNPNLPLYPNPTKDCSWDCDAATACVLMDAGGDWEGELNSVMIPRNEEELTWRQHLP